MRRNHFNILLIIFLLLSCQGSEKDLLPLESFYFPVDLVYDNHDNLYVISSNFDLGYKFGNVKAISISRLKPLLSSGCKDGCPDYNTSVILDEGISIGDYAGISVFYNGKIFVPLRKDDKIAIIDVDSNGSLSCGSNEKVLGDCDRDHLIETEYREPFALAMRDYDSCIYTSFHKSGYVLCIDVNQLGQRPNLFADFTNGYEIGGIRDIDISDKGVLLSAYAYLMSGRNVIPISYEFEKKRYTVFLDFTDVAGSAFQESIRLSRSKDRFFISFRNPDMLLYVDYAIYKDGTFIVVDYRTLPLYRYPSRLYIESSKSAQREFLFASLIDEDRVFVFDTETGGLISEIKEGLDGPYAMRLIEIEKEEYLFVANFENSTVSVYRFIPAKNGFDYILSIGRPRQKAKGEY